MLLGAGILAGGAVSVVVLVVVISWVSTLLDEPVVPDPQRGPYDVAASIAPSRVRVEPTAVPPGTTVRLTFPDTAPPYASSELHGEGWVLERRQPDGTWRLDYYLTGQEARTPPPIWYPVTKLGEVGWTDMAYYGPMYVRIPDSDNQSWLSSHVAPPTAPGDYRLCHASGEPYCAAIAITPRE